MPAFYGRRFGPLDRSLHGLDMPPATDGHSVIDPQSEFVYEFKVTNRAGTYWYHPHPDNRTDRRSTRVSLDWC